MQPQTMQSVTSGPVPSRRRRTAKPPADVPPPIIPRLVAGTIGSIVTALVLTPLEVVKVRQQAAHPGVPSASLPSNVSLCPRGCGTFVLNNGLMDCLLPKSAVSFFDSRGAYIPPSYIHTSNNMGTWGMLRRIFLNEGFRGIYSGLRPTLVMSVPSRVLFFTSYDEIVTRLRCRFGKDNKTWIPLVSGSSARLLASTITAPLELLRTRQAALIGNGELSPGMWGEFRIIVQREGPGALFQGLAPTLWRDVPFSAIYWFCLERFKILWDANSEDGLRKSPLREAGEAFVDGAIAGMIAAAATTPFDVVKTRRQTGSIRNGSAAVEAVCHHDGAAVYKPFNNSPTNRVSTFAVMKEIVQQEGLQGLWRGNQTRMMKAAPACAIMISCYEFGKRIME